MPILDVRREEEQAPKDDDGNDDTACEGVLLEDGRVLTSCDKEEVDGMACLVVSCFCCLFLLLLIVVFA